MLYLCGTGPDCGINTGLDTDPRSSQYHAKTMGLSSRITCEMCAQGFITQIDIHILHVTLDFNLVSHDYINLCQQ